jgi:hypothetical protein
MSSLMIRCPMTGLDIWTGIDTDLDSLNSISDTLVYAACPHCGFDHASWPDGAWLTDDASPGASGKRTLAA